MKKRYIVWQRFCVSNRGNCHEKGRHQSQSETNLALWSQTLLCCMVSDVIMLAS